MNTNILKFVFCFQSDVEYEASPAKRSTSCEIEDILNEPPVLNTNPTNSPIPIETTIIDVSPSNTVHNVISPNLSYSLSSLPNLETLQNEGTSPNAVLPIGDCYILTTATSSIVTSSFSNTTTAASEQLINEVSTITSESPAHSFVGTSDNPSVQMINDPTVIDQSGPFTFDSTTALTSGPMLNESNRIEEQVPNAIDDQLGDYKQH